MSIALIQADIKTCQSPTFSLATLLNWVLDSACALLFAYNSLFITFSDLVHCRSFWTISSFQLTIQRLPLIHVTIPTRMRYITIAWIFLILSIINFALAAPVLVRGVREMHVNVVDVAEDGLPHRRSGGTRGQEMIGFQTRRTRRVRQRPRGCQTWTIPDYIT
jgi:hypothetical protein